MIQALESNVSLEDAKARLQWCKENPGVCSDAEMAAMEALISHHNAMADLLEDHLK